MKNAKELVVNIDNEFIPYTLLDNNKAKNIKLVIDTRGLRVVKPPKVKFEDVQKVLESKSKWILKHYMKILSMRDAEYKRNWENGEYVLYIGEKYTISVFLHKKKLTKVNFNGIIFEIFVNDTAVENDRKSLIENAFKKWYMKMAHQNFEERLEYFCKITGLTYQTMKIRDQKTRWGSCSRKGNLNFNWGLIMSPQWVIDYVIVHEICHLRYLNHSKNYWSLVEKYMPNYKLSQEWLRKNGGILTNAINK